MSCAKPFITRNIHPSIICQAFYMALEETTKIIKEISSSREIDPKRQTFPEMN